jgi:hypothetical protein
MPAERCCVHLTWRYDGPSFVKYWIRKFGCRRSRCRNRLSLKDEAKEDKRLVNATHGRRARSIIIMDSNHVVLSAIQAETISQRYAMLKELT